ncbi:MULTISPECIES: ABC transporter permease [unclassified Oceanobacter]|uniref:ABC transporter permease n=1 Tax=unclassified Oceanobacter TaxID=2620260 RepID=UPI00273732E4|nr:MULTISPECIES: ABC transporter permease [unclassified Oceanobacter]MDP2609340.1 ABC transporter permease [Oceanobacter sp. 1_MG-2023]MDP2612723.1 ABC transporter permease [Oceanobacter sp. 2_MG-2023]
MSNFRLTLERRQQVSTLRSAATYILGLLVGLGCGVLVLLAAGAPASTLMDDLVVQVFFSARGLAQTLTLAVPLIMVGLAALAAMRLRFWNVGIEGQLWLGAIGATLVANNDFGSEALRLPIMLIASALAGAIWIAVPLLLKLKANVNELVVTLLLSNVAYLLLQHLLFGAWKDPVNSFPVSPRFDDNEQLASLGFGNLHSGIYLALAITLLMAVLVQKSRTGFYIDVIGHNRRTALATGIPVTATLTLMILLSGALAGLAGGLIVTGVEHRLTQTIGINTTFSGIVIAFVARFNPLAILPTAIALAGIYNAGSTLKVFYGIPDAIVVLIQGIVLLTLLMVQFFRSYRVSLLRRTPPQTARQIT